MSSEPPEQFSIHKGKIMKVEAFGAFVAMEGYRKHGLVHISQFAEHKVESAEEFVSVDDEVCASRLSASLSFPVLEPPASVVRPLSYVVRL